MKKKESKKISFIEKTQTVNEEGQKIETAIKTSYSSSSEPDYVKLYLSDISRLYSIPKFADNVLYSLLKRLDYNNEVVISAGIRKRICEELKYQSTQVVSNAISKLVKNKVLIKRGIGIYKINPFIIGKGKWSKILKDRETIELTISYSPKSGRTQNIKTFQEEEQTSF